MKLLVIVSRDYGELGHALYFLDQLALKAPPIFMLPAALSDPGIGDVDADVRHYAGLDDIAAAIKEGAPDAVLLFSGYLLQLGTRFSLLNSLRLLSLLRRKRIPVLTSDPFIGAVRHPFSLDFYVPIRAARRATGARQRARARVDAWALGLRLYLLRLSLRRVWHVYPARVLPGALPKNVQWSGYFNGKAQARHQATAPVQAEQAAPSWVFVLSQIDGDILMEAGSDAFIGVLCDRLDDAVRAGRRAVLVAGARVLAALPPQWHDTPGVELRAQGGYADYMDLVMAAQYSFFWNYFSFSIIHRVIARRPVFFFGGGHMVRILPSLATHGIDNLYAGEAPALLSMDAPLDAAALAERAGEVAQQFTRIHAGLRTLPSPADLLRTVRQHADEPEDDG